MGGVLTLVGLVASKQVFKRALPSCLLCARRGDLLSAQNAQDEASDASLSRGRWLLLAQAARWVHGFCTVSIQTRPVRRGPRPYSSRCSVNWMGSVLASVAGGVSDFFRRSTWMPPTSKLLQTVGSLAAMWQASHGLDPNPLCPFVEGLKNSMAGPWGLLTTCGQSASTSTGAASHWPGSGCESLSCSCSATSLAEAL